MTVEIVQQRRALCFGHVLEAQREGAVDVECLSAGLAVGANDWMLDLVVRLLAEVEAHRGGTIFLGARRVDAVRATGAVHRSQPRPSARRLRRRVSQRCGLIVRVRSVTGKCIFRPLALRSGLVSSSATVIGAYLSSQTVARSWLT